MMKHYSVYLIDKLTKWLIQRFDVETKSKHKAKQVIESMIIADGKEVSTYIIKIIEKTNLQ